MMPRELKARREALGLTQEALALARWASHERPLLVRRMVQAA